MSSTVRLTPTEMYVAAIVGAARQCTSVVRGMRDAHGWRDRDGFGDHTLGAAGEMAVAKLLGIYWCPRIDAFSDADLGSDIQVKTRPRADWDLLVRPNDPDEHRFYLVTGKGPDFCVHGWAYGHEAKRGEFLKEHGGRPPAYFMPQNELRPVEVRT